MKITITEYEKKYEFNLDTVAQLCGQNIGKKRYIVESIRKYFGTFKYSEEKNPWRDNVFIDDNAVGRKYYQVITISDFDELKNSVNMSKQSLLLQYLKFMLQDFDCQKELDKISSTLDSIYLNLNEKIQELGAIMLNYKANDIWDIIQKSDVTGVDETELDNMSFKDLLEVFFSLVKQLMIIEPKNYMIIFPNLDHNISKSEYLYFYNKMQNLSYLYNVKFIITISLDDYLVVTKDNLEEISIFNDVDFTFPNYFSFKAAVLEQYPVYCELDDMDLLKHLSRIVHRIGVDNSLIECKENVICKIINNSLLIKSQLYEKMNQNEVSFLYD